MRQPLKAMGSLLGLALTALPLGAQAAEQVVFVSGAFRRSIPVADLELLAKTGQAEGLLADVLRLGRQKPQDVAKLLNQRISLPLVLTSRLLNTRIGEAVLNRVSAIVYPLNAKGVAVPALRAATIIGLKDNSDSLSAVAFLRAYPNDDLAISLPALLSTVSKASSIAELVRFFSESPLDGLKAPGPSKGPS
ncbi:alpha/beta hydrolase [Cyanobium sp. Morenito 9A2]|uniref:alpha/beta hydrolase n=1 Tax=Cyanobium sp. Morenito 9A2 TaxID=2823718 RepID=UPI0028F446C0|nr:alpha/beta hydrolase [Cyanobium sp. Morenito 9A2]